ncbi:hypothetical protein ACA910_014599 [Epithemia clementina (nom. ined.)]
MDNSKPKPRRSNVTSQKGTSSKTHESSASPKKRKQPPAKAKAQPPRQEGRPRSKTSKSAKSNGGGGGSPRRPPAPPAPPAPLVKLLQSNRAVLEYFQSLQANLDADVQIWKDRAKEYQQKYEELQQQLLQEQQEKLQTKPQSNDTETPPNESTASRLSKPRASQKNACLDGGVETYGEDASVEEMIEPPLKQAGGQDESSDNGVPIEDSMLEFDSDDSTNYNDNEMIAARRDDDDVGKMVDSAKPKARIDEDKDEDDTAAANSAEAQLQKEMQAVLALDSSSDDSDGEEDKDHNSNDDEKAINEDRNKTDITGKRKRASPGFFALESSSDDDDDKDDNDDWNGKEQQFTGMEQQLFDQSSTTQRLENADDVQTPANQSQVQTPQVFSLLREAFQALEIIGVSLVEEKPTSLPSPAGESNTENAPSPSKTVEDDAVVAPRTEGDDQSEQEPNEVHEEGKTVWIPRSNDDVAADIVWSIHSLSRIQLLDKDFLETYHPFVTDDLIPSCNYIGRNNREAAAEFPENPIAKGKSMAFRALLILDTYCGDEGFMNSFVPVDQRGDAEAKKIMISLKGRKQMVESLVSSLDGEIRRCWPEQDRADSFNTVAFHNNISTDKPQQKDEDSADMDMDTDVSCTGGRSEKGRVLDSKIQGRLSRLVERAVLVQLVVAYYISRDDPDQVADLVWHYLLSTAPCQNEDHPKLSPVTSFIVLESMLVLQPNIVWWLPCQQEDGNPCTLWKMLFYGEDMSSCNALWAEKSLRLCLQLVASIWKYRETTARTSRIRDLARVEVAAYRRLIKAGILHGDDGNIQFEDWRNRATAFSREPEYLKFINDQGGKGSRLALFSYQLSLIVGHQGPSSLLFDMPSANEIGHFLIARVEAMREIEIRKLESHRSMIGAKAAMSTPFEMLLQDQSAMILNEEDSYSLETTSSLLRVATIVANAKAALDLAQKIINLVDSRQDVSEESKCCALSLFGEVSQVPVARVINLRCRPDRLKAFHVQAMLHGLTVVLAVAALNVDENGFEAKDENAFFGRFAFDGRGKWLQATERLSNEVGTGLDSFVSTHWRPHDLKAFDTNAPDGERLVRASPSERACALSHIASWKGALRSFRTVREEMTNGSSSLLRRSDVLLRLFHLSGFAEGTAMHVSNRNNHPSPVCLILEDDAILVDRFTDRLGDLLRELPRDFHFCSLGYSRPKTAPIVAYRKHVGIPTNLFYLTGYLISEAGAGFLLDNLPVTGPVDSWIGLKMTNNFENVFGNIVGIGRSKPLADPLSNKDLCTILKFRAFCALQPLCAQRVGSTAQGGPSAASTELSGRSWRHRDTDIEYSGGKWNYNGGTVRG